MPYIDDLSDDRVRVTKALASLIEEQEQLVRDLTRSLAEYRETLDRAIIRALIFRNLYGPTQTLALMAETDAQEASSPVTETETRLDRETQLLYVYRETLKDVEGGTPFSTAAGKYL